MSSTNTNSTTSLHYGSFDSSMSTSVSDQNSDLKETNSGGGSSGDSQRTVPAESDTNDSDPTGQIQKYREMEAWGILYHIEDCYKTLHLISDKPYTIGRDPRCTYHIKMEDGFQNAADLKTLFTNLSARHFRIWREINENSGDVFIEDTSSNGTYINGALIGKNNKTKIENCSKIALAQKQKEAFTFVNVQAMLDEYDKLPPEFRKTYILERTTLGRGAFGDVRCGRCIGSARRVAVKLIKQRGSTFNGNITYEATLIKDLKHDNIVQVYDIFSKKDMLYIVLELVEGGDLFNYLEREGAIIEIQCKRLFLQLLKAVSYLHSKQIIHRDLKPENILLTSTNIESCNTKITDFGFSRFLASTSMMQTLCGTPAYVAPEIFNSCETGNGYTGGVDVWSLGCVLYTMLSRMLPFPQREHNKLKDAVCGGLYSFVGGLWNKVSGEAKDLLSHMLTVEVDKRITLERSCQHVWFCSRSVKRKVDDISSSQ